MKEGHTVHYLAVVPFPIKHDNCHFHRFPWPAQHTDNIFFWIVFHLLAPGQLLVISFKYRVNRLYAFGTNYGFLLQPVRILKQIPLALFIRADVIQNHRLKKRSRLIISTELIVEALAIRNVRLFGVSQTLVNQIRERHKFFKPELYDVLRNEIPELPSEQGSCGTSKDENRKMIRLGSVGILEKRKNQLFLLDVIAGLNNTKFELLFFGIGEDKVKLESKIRELSLQEQVKFKGWIKSEKIWSEIDLLLMPSLHEGAPNAVLEAIAYGVPVLASDISEHREILPETVLIPLGEPNKWIERVRDLDRSGQIFDGFLIKEIKKKVKYTLNINWNELVVNYVCKL